MRQFLHLNLFFFVSLSWHKVGAIDDCIFSNLFRGIASLGTETFNIELSNVEYHLGDDALTTIKGSDLLSSYVEFSDPSSA